MAGDRKGDHANGKQEVYESSKCLCLDFAWNAQVSLYFGYTTSRAAAVPPGKWLCIPVPLIIHQGMIWLADHCRPVSHRFS